MESQCEEFLNTLHHFKRMSCKLKPSNFAHSEFITLGAIAHMVYKKPQDNEPNKGVKVSELAKMLHTSKPDVSKKIRILEEKELIERIHDPKDKRVILLTLTKKGEEEFEHTKQETESFITNVFNRMGKQDADALLMLLKKMVQAIGDEMADRKILGKGDE